LALSVGKKTETSAQLILSLSKQPKPFTKETEEILDTLQEVAKTINLTITTRASGGLSDGNILAEAGLPSLDTMGVIGGELHTPNEYMEIESMVERAKLTYLFLDRFAKG